MRPRISAFATLLAAFIAASALVACYKPVANTTAGDDGSGQETYGSPAEGPESGTEREGGSKEEGEAVENQSGPVAGGFRANAEANLKRNGLELRSVVDEASAVETRIFKEYGAVLLTRAVPPPKMMFTSDAETDAFQNKAGISGGDVGGTKIELQAAAMESLKKAVADASSEGLSITPRDGAEAGRRSYGKTLELWNSRFLKACDHWQGKGRLTAAQVAGLKALPIKDQVDEVLKLEESGIYFNTFFNNSILYSVAAPGTSQHLSMLALDVSEFSDERVRRVLARHGWFRTVQNDEPHFTYLGLEERDLPSYGLKKVTKNGGEYWIPDV